MPSLADIEADPKGVLSQVLGAPVTITSAERSPDLNRRVGGSPTSEHQPGYGHAYDFDAKGMSEGQIAAKLAASGIPYDQVIREGNHVHIGFRPDGVAGRHQNLIKEGSSYVPAGATASPAVNAAMGGIDLSGLPKLGDLYKQRMAKQEAVDKAGKEAVAANEEAAAAARDIGKALPLPAAPPAPKLSDLPQPIDMQLHTDPMRVFGQMMPMLVAFGSLATRAGGIGALNAATAAMTAAKTNDKDALERAHEEWKDKTAQALDQNKLEMDKFNAVREQIGLTVSERQAEYERILAEHPNPTLKAQLATGDLAGFDRTIDNVMQAAKYNREILDKAEEHDERRAMISIDKERADYERMHGPVDQRVFEQWKEEHPKAKAEDAAKFLTTLSMAKKPGTKLSPPQEAAKFVDDLQQADPQDETTKLDYDGLSATPKEWAEAIGALTPSARQVELKSRFLQANKDSIKIAEAAGSQPAAPAAAPKAVQRPEAPRDPAQRHKGWVYSTPKGNMLWDGEAWHAVNV